MTTANIKMLHTCSFCGKNQTQVKTLVSGNGAFICNECVELCMDVIKPVTPEPEPSTSASDLTPPQIVSYLDDHVIGQQLAKKTLSVAIYNHLKRIQHPEVDGVQLSKSNLMLVGPSGVGKTHMVSTLAQILKVPFAVVDATSLSQTGYVGLDPEECLVRLYQAAEQDVAKAEHGIIFIDEVDKIGRKTGENASTTRDVSGEGVQQALLKIIEGNVVKFTPGGGRKHPQGEFVTMNTKNILFILGGAFDGIQHVIQQRVKQDHSQMGFMGQIVMPDSDQNTWRLLQQVDTEDLISYGMIPEMVGRIPIILPFENLDVHMLTRILTEPKNAVLKQFQAQFKLEGIQLEVPPESCEQIAQQVIDTKTGARGLRRVLEKILLHSLYQVHELVHSGVHTIRVTPECVLSGTEPDHVID